MGKTDAEVHFSLYDRTKKEERPSTQAKTQDLTTGSNRILLLGGYYLECWLHSS